MADELLDVADELYGLPLAEFTPARDARAKALKGTEHASRVKALRKPSLAAWVVNLLVRYDTEAQLFGTSGAGAQFLARFLVQRGWSR